MSAWPFTPGVVYNRKRDIHDQFGGQERGGIATPTNASAVILFSGHTGTKHGYADSFEPDGSFHYCGEGQKGDMRMVRGNVAIRDHALRGNDVLLFQTTKKKGEAKYVGEFVCRGWRTEERPDTEGFSRSAIIFELVPLSSLSADSLGPVVDAPSDLEGFKKLRARALAAASNIPKSQTVPTDVFTRSRIIRDYALARAGGSCENCMKDAPFKTASGQSYLEVHHIRRLTDGGPDHPSGVAAICPNCHRELHYGVDGAAKNLMLLDLIRSVEKRTIADLGLLRN
jgi:5-methylcytosine-specific restriction protein A